MRRCFAHAAGAPARRAPYCAAQPPPHRHTVKRPANPLNRHAATLLAGALICGAAACTGAPAAKSAATSNCKTSPSPRCQPATVPDLYAAR